MTCYSSSSYYYSHLTKKIKENDIMILVVNKKFYFSALQRHYAVLQALALEEDDIPEMKDETLPDEEGLAR